MKRTIVAAVFVGLAHQPIQAGETQWVELMPDVTMRLITSDTITDEGRIWMGLEIDMPDHIKTYWRVPGETGIPLSMSTSHGEANVEWPYPIRETEAGYVDHVYYGHTVIPFSIEAPTKRQPFSADVALGICSDICVPANARFEIALETGAPDRTSQLRIRQALALAPLPMDADDVVGHLEFDPDRKVLVAKRLDARIDPQSIIASIEDTGHVFDAPHREGEDLIFPLLGRIDLESLSGTTAQLTFQTTDGPYVIARSLQLP